MAKTELKIIIDAKDNASAKMKKMQKSLANVRSGLNKYNGVVKGATLALGGLVAVSKKAIDMFGVQERAEARLTAGLRNVEGMTDRNSEALIEYAKELQKVSTFGDETIVSTMGMLSTFQLNEKQIRELTPRIIDMTAALEKSTGTQQDMEAVSIAVGKAMTLGVGSLTRYGVVISDADKDAFQFADTQEKLNIITRNLDANFKGIAEEVAGTTTGKMKQLSNVIGDLQEQFGGVIAEAITPFVKTLSDWAQKDETAEKIKIIAGTIIEIGKTMVDIGKGVKKFGEIMGTAMAWPISKLIELDGWLDRIGMKFSNFKKQTVGRVSTLWDKATSWIPGLAEGGIVTKPTLAMIGEKGAEAVVPLDKAGEIGGSTYNFDFSNATITDKDQLIREIKGVMDRESELKNLGGT